MRGSFHYAGEAWRLPDRLVYQAATLADAELNRFLDEVLPRFGRRLWGHQGHNLVTNQGAQWLCGRFDQAQPTTAWYVLFKGAGAIAESNTASSHSPWLELHTFYSQTTRPALTMPVPTSGRSTNNSTSLASVVVQANATIDGFGLISSSVKGGRLAFCMVLAIMAVRAVWLSPTRIVPRYQ